MTPPRLYDAPNALGYVRVSTTDQDLSLEVQTARIRGLALARDFTLGDVLVDPGESGKSLNRPGMIELLARVDARAVDTVVVAKLDRLTRSIADLAVLLQRLDKRGVALVSAAESLDTGSAMGRMQVNLFTLIAQWERETISERTRDALQHKKSQGERVGKIPFGYRLAADQVHLEVDEDEQELGAQVRALRAAGHSTRQIADTLNALGRTTRTGGAWRFQYVARMLSAAVNRAAPRRRAEQPGLFDSVDATS